MLALPGGSVASAFLPTLARRQLPWSSIHLFWVDERAVAVTATASNVGLARRIAAGTPMQAALWHAAAASPAVLDTAALAYGRSLAAVAGEPPVVDVVLLGVGEDGHVASIFPNSTRGTDGAIVAAVHDAPKDPPHRISFTLSTICAARHVVVAAFGSSKHAAVLDALTNPGSGLPLAAVLRGTPAPRSLLLLDEEAAGRLHRPPTSP